VRLDSATLTPSGTQIQLIVILWAYCANTIGRVILYLIALNPNNYLWMSIETVNSVSISSLNSAPRTGLFDISAPVDIPDITNFEIIPLITSW